MVNADFCMNSTESTTAKTSQESHPTTMILNCGSCAYKTEDLPETAAITTLNSHTGGTHNNTGGSSRIERKKRPTIKTEISMQEWAYFLRRHNRGHDEVRTDGMLQREIKYGHRQNTPKHTQHR